MAGGPASETIMFTAAILAAALVAGSLSGVAGELSQGMDARAEDLGGKLRGRFDIVNDPLNMPYTDPDLTVYVKNTGSQTFYTSQFVVLIDGTASGDLTFTVDGAAADSLKPGQLLEITVGDAAGLNNDHFLSVIAGNGHKETMEFTI